MSLYSTANKAVHLANGATTVWPFSFPVLDAAHVTVLLTDAAGAESVLAPASFALAGVGDPAGGSVTYPLTGPALAAGNRLTILRTVPYVQGTVLSNQGGYYPEVVETAFDRIYMALQQHEERLERSLTAAPTDSAPSFVLPAAPVRASRLPAFDADGDIALSNLTLAELEAQPAGAASSAVQAAASAAAAGASASAAAASATQAANSAGTIAGSSASPVAIGTGAKSFATQAGKQFAAGMWLLLADSAAPSANWMLGQVTAYDSGSGALTVDVTASGGAGTVAAWTISLSGPRGIDGASYVTTRGDLIKAGAGGTPARFAIGTPYQVLRVNAAGDDLEYARGGFRLIASDAVPAGAGSVDFTGWTSATKMVRITGFLYPTTPNVEFRTRYYKGGSLLTTNNYYFSWFAVSSSGVSNGYAGPQTYYGITGQQVLAEGIRFELAIAHPSQTKAGQMIINYAASENASFVVRHIGTMQQNNNGPFTGLSLYFSSGTIAGGYVVIEGVEA